MKLQFSSVAAVTLILFVGYQHAVWPAELSPEEDKTIRQPDPRGHHYYFAHRYLPYLLFTDTDNIRERLEKNGEEYLKWLWTRCGRRVSEAERIATDGLGISLKRPEPDVTVIIIRYPAPQGITETYFTALVFWGDKVAYMTLEYGWDSKAACGRTVLGEWDSEGTHHNYGTGPEPSEEAFLRSILTRMKQ